MRLTLQQLVDNVLLPFHDLFHDLFHVGGRAESNLQLMTLQLTVISITETSYRCRPYSCSSFWQMIHIMGASSGYGSRMVPMQLTQSSSQLW